MTNCPKCGAEEELPRHKCGCRFWFCESRKDDHGVFFQSAACRIAELEAALKPFSTALLHAPPAPVTLRATFEGEHGEFDAGLTMGDFKAADEALAKGGEA